MDEGSETLLLSTFCKNFQHTSLQRSTLCNTSCSLSSSHSPDVAFSNPFEHLRLPPML